MDEFQTMSRFPETPLCGAQYSQAGTGDGGQSRVIHRTGIGNVVEEISRLIDVPRIESSSQKNLFVFSPFDLEHAATPDS
jgi:hypothetical protein